MIFSERDPAAELYIVLSGKVQLSNRGEPLDIEEEGGIIGEMAIIDPTAHNSTATALTAVKLARIDSEQFRQLIRNEPDFSLHAMATLARRLRAVDALISRRLA